MKPEQLQAIRERVNKANADSGKRLTQLLNDGHVVAQFWECIDGHKFYCDLEDNEPEGCPVCACAIEFGDSFVIVPQDQFIAHAREDLPNALDHIAQLTDDLHAEIEKSFWQAKEIERLRTELQHIAHATTVAAANKWARQALEGK